MQSAMAPHNAHSNTTYNQLASHQDNDSPLHFLLLPFPAQGHINPMLAFAAQLLHHGCQVTCVLMEHVHRKMLASSNNSSQLHDVHFVTISDSSLADDAQGSKLDMSTDTLVRILNAVKQQESFLESLVRSSKATPSPISCIVSDFMFPWVQDVADKCAIPRVLFWMCSAATFYVGSVAKAGGIHPGAPELEEINRKLHISTRAILDSFYKEDPADMRTFHSIYQRLDEPSHILINTFEALEGHLLSLLPANTRYIGPLLPPAHAAATSERSLHIPRAGSLRQEDMSCLRWLDEQEDHSVLFISFGSIASFPPLQMQEIALGLEASNHKFLWVARPDSTTNTSFPTGFIERTKERGLVIPWAPQLQVLNHPAVGGFLTHCGWNSILESIFMGIPMLCFPIFAEQPLNAELVMSAATHADEFKDTKTPIDVGLGFEARRAAGIYSSHVVSSQEVERAVRALMGGPGEELREHACQLMEHAKGAVNHECGSSHAGLTSFINDIRHHCLTGSNSHEQRSASQLDKA